MWCAVADSHCTDVYKRQMGRYEATEKGVLKIGPLASTMMACPGMEQEDAFTKALESTTHYDMDGPMLLLSLIHICSAALVARGATISARYPKIRAARTSNPRKIYGMGMWRKNSILCP